MRIWDRIKICVCFKRDSLGAHYIFVKGILKKKKSCFGFLITKRSDGGNTCVLWKCYRLVHMSAMLVLVIAALPCTLRKAHGLVQMDVVVK